MQILIIHQWDILDFQILSEDLNPTCYPTNLSFICNANMQVFPIFVQIAVEFFELDEV